MKLKIIIKNLIGFFVGVFVTLILIRTYYGEPPTSAKFAVYQIESNNILCSLIRLIPASESIRMEEKEIQKKGSYTLIKLNDKKYNPSNQYYFLKNGNKLNSLKIEFPPVNDKNITIENYHSYLINKEVFNEYLTVFYPNIDNESIIDKYCLFLSTIMDTNSYRVIDDIEDIRLIIDESPKKTNHPYPEHKLIQNFQNIFDKSKSNERTFVWFYDKGIIELEYIIKDNKIESIKTNFIGYIGNEDIHM
tara:strand:- start:50864 stop:51607 length:744 start_codon:yes stop_codon:yes gene_type:complete